MRELINVFGTEPAEVRERTVGEPARRSRRLVFASGGEIILHDDAVVAVVFRLTSTLTAARGLDLSKWIAGVGNDATLDDLAKAVGARPRFAGLKSRTSRSTVGTFSPPSPMKAGRKRETLSASR